MMVLFESLLGFFFQFTSQSLWWVIVRELLWCTQVRMRAFTGNSGVRELLWCTHVRMRAPTGNSGLPGADAHVRNGLRARAGVRP